MNARILFTIALGTLAAHCGGGSDEAPSLERPPVPGTQATDDAASIGFDGAPRQSADGATQDAACIGFDGSPQQSADGAPHDASATDLTPLQPAEGGGLAVGVHLSHLGAVLDRARRGVPTWAELAYVEPGTVPPRLHRFGYGDTASRNDFWPASTVKVYPAMATLVLLNSLSFSLDATATFERETGGDWVTDLSRSFREMIDGALVCSSNEDYTLLLRFVGIDWLNQSYFSKSNGFQETALMQGYVSARPYGYTRAEPQRIIVKEGGRTHTREHTWSKISYANRVGCSSYNSGGTANCTSPRDLIEHLFRIMYHEQLDTSLRYEARQSDLDWLRFSVLNQKSKCGGDAWSGVSRVFPKAEFYHKGGSVSDYKIDLSHVRDSETGRAYFIAAATESDAADTLERIAEEVARMVRTPGYYVHLDALPDQVNPVTATGMAYAMDPTSVRLVVKPIGEDPHDLSGWKDMPGTSVAVRGGLSLPALASSCVAASGKVYVRAKMSSPYPFDAFSDLHTVIVDASKPCP